MKTDFILLLAATKINISWYRSISLTNLVNWSIYFINSVLKRLLNLIFIKEEKDTYWKSGIYQTGKIDYNFWNVLDIIP